MGGSRNILVTGATGYIGGRLVPRLIEEGYSVRVLVRSRSRIASRPWAGQVEVSVGDVRDSRALQEAMHGIDSAYYLIHSMGSGPGFRDLDVELARSFGHAAKEAGVRHIIYLGGLGEPDGELSAHLRSRQESGQALREGGVHVTEFRAAVIVGTGSVSFEIIRHLVERLPVMVCPKWIYSRIQPIAIDDILDYLVAALSVPGSKDRVIEIGGRGVTTYRDLILRYAKARGLKRLLLSVPVLTPRLSSYWVHWMTPIHASIAAPLIEGLRNDVVVTDSLARTLFPHIVPKDYDSAIEEVTRALDEGRVETSWRDAVGSALESHELVQLDSRNGLIVERRRVHIAASATNVYGICTGIGGKRGWYFGNWAWRLRGMIDLMLGGIGLRRGRRHPDDLRVGDALDLWRVEALETDRFLRLRSEMKLPGNAWLQFDIREVQEGITILEQKAVFSPRGLTGLLYWYSLYPIHGWIFKGLVKAIAKRAEYADAAQEAQIPEYQIGDD